MPSLTFPTRPTIRGEGKRASIAPPGTPLEADPCRCRHGVTHDTECVWCGHLPDEVIRRTWAERARALDRTSATATA